MEGKNISIKLESQISGEDFGFESIDVYDLCNILIDFKRILENYLTKKNERNYLYLARLEPGSAVPVLEAKQSISEHYNAFEQFLVDVERKKIKEKAIPASSRIWKKIQKYKMRFQVRTFGHYRDITESFGLFNSLLNESFESLFGEISLVDGGKQQAQIETIQGEAIDCYLQSKEIAIDWGKNLYKDVKVDGLSKYKPETGEITRFYVEEYEILKEEMSIEEWLKSLPENFCSHLKGIEDIDGYVRRIRNDEADSDF